MMTHFTGAYISHQSSILQKVYEYIIEGMWQLFLI